MLGRLSEDASTLQGLDRDMHGHEEHKRTVFVAQRVQLQLCAQLRTGRSHKGFENRRQARRGIPCGVRADCACALAIDR